MTIQYAWLVSPLVEFTIADMPDVPLGVNARHRRVFSVAEGLLASLVRTLESVSAVEKNRTSTPEPTTEHLGVETI